MINPSISPFHLDSLSSPVAIFALFIEENEEKKNRPKTKRLFFDTTYKNPCTRFRYQCSTACSPLQYSLLLLLFLLLLLIPWQIFPFPALFISALISLIRPYFVASSKKNHLTSSFTSNILKTPQVPGLLLLSPTRPAAPKSSRGCPRLRLWLFFAEKKFSICDSFSRLPLDCLTWSSLPAPCQCSRQSP